VGLPSLIEGVPAAALEAMAAGKPIIATNVGGLGEVLADGVSGRVIEPGNTDALVAALDECLSVGEQALSRMGERARQHVIAHYHIDTILAKIWSLYDASAHTLRIPNSALRTAYNSKMSVEGSQE
jgi:glycosyltransferase involved in cell wall biosynthesis